MFNKDLKIGQGEKWDISQISQDEISLEELTKNKKKLIQIFNSFNMNGSETLDNVELLKAMDYFGNLDTDGDGKLSKKELEKGAQYLNTQLSLEGKDAIKSKDLKNFIKNIVKATKDNETVNADDMFSFDEGDLDIQNVTGSRTEENDGVKSTVLTYDDGREVTTNPGGTYNVKNTDENGTVVTQFYSAGNKLLRETSVDADNNTRITDYDPKQSEQVPLRSVSTVDNGAHKYEINYVDGKPSTGTYTGDGGSTVEVYEYKNDERRITSRVENKGQEEQTITHYSYSGGTIQAEVLDEDGVRYQVLDSDYNVVSEEAVLKTGIIINKEPVDGGLTKETVSDVNIGRTSTTVYTPEHNRVSQTVDVNGTKYEVQYDGSGNTNIVVQNGESPAVIAKKFGCTLEDLKSLNADKLHGKGENSYFMVGDTIKIPGELDADAAVLQGRDSKEQALAKYEAHQAKVQQQKDAADEALEARKDYTRTFTNTTYDTFEQQARACFVREGNNNPSEYELKLRIKELQELNPNIKDGELKGKKITATFAPETYASIGQGQLQREEARQVQKAKQEAAEAAPLAQDMYTAISDHSAGVSEQSFKDALAKVDKDNVVGVLEAYDKLSPNENLIEAVFDEWGNSGATKSATSKVFINALYDRAVSAGVDKEHAAQLRDAAISELNKASCGNTDKLVGSLKNMVATINTAEHVTREERTSKVTDNSTMRDSTIDAGLAAYEENNSNLQAQLDRDGWCADLYEGLKWCVGSDNLDENVKADLTEFRSTLGELQLAKVNGGDEAFDAKFKEIFGVDYDPNLARGYSKMQNDYANASALTVQIEGFDKEFASSINGQESYATMVQKYGDYIKSVNPEITDGNVAVETGIALAMEKDNIDFNIATEDQKKQYLINILSDTQKGFKTELEKYTRGKSLDTMKKDLDQACVSVFGNKGDIVSRVNNYVISQQKGGAATAAVLKVAGAIAVTVLTGGTGTAALLTAAGSTAAISATVDLTDRATSKVGLQDGEVFNILKNATIDGATVFAGGKLTKAAMCFKNPNAFVQAGGRMLAQTSGDVAIGAAAEYGQTGEITIEGVTFQAIFSGAGNLIALKQIKNAGTAPKADNPALLPAGPKDTPQLPSGKTDVSPVSSGTADKSVSLPDNDFLRTTQNGNDFNKVAPENAVGTLNQENFDNAVNYYRNVVENADEAAIADLSQRAASLNNRNQSRTLQHIVDDEQLMRRISTETNLGELHNLEKQISSWSDANRNTDALLDAIHHRQNDLIAEGSYTVAARDIDPAVAERAEAALSKSKRHLLPDEISDIRQYIESLTTPAALDNVVSRLQQRGIKLSSGSKLKHTIDAKYAELNATRPAGQAPEQPLVAENEIYISPHERRIISQADDAAGTYTLTPDEFSLNPVHSEVGPVVQTPEPSVLASQVQADAVAQSVSTPRLDRINPGSGRLGGFAKKQITDEVVASVNAAQTPQELTALRDKISQKILNPEFRDGLLAKVDSRLEQLNRNPVITDNGQVIQTSEHNVLTSHVQADAVAQSVGTPRLDRINPGSGRLSNFTKKQITDEVVASINAAKTPQELMALRDKISQKILNTEFRDDLLAKVDSRLEQLK